MRLAHELRLGEEERYALYYALLLKDVGCSSSAARMCELFGTDDIALKTHGKLVDWTKPAAGRALHLAHVAGGGRIARAQRTLSVLRSLVAEGKAIVETRCDRGAAIVTSLGFPPATADAVRALDEYWDGRGQPFGLQGDAIPLPARIACLSQTAEVFFATHGLAAAQEMVRERRGRWFDPELADTLLAIAPDDRLWSDLASDDVAALVRELEPADRVLVLDEAGIDRICEAFADVIDAKSPFTARHSRGVATYAGLIGERARPAVRGSARPLPRRDAARHRQARNPEHDPRQARQARRRGVRAHPPAPGLHGEHPRGHPRLRRLRRHRRRPPRAPGRPRLSPRRPRRRPPGERPRPGSRRRLRGA